MKLDFQDERPLQRPKMIPAHEEFLNDPSAKNYSNESFDFNSIEINEHVPAFSNTDSDVYGQRPDMPPCNGLIPPEMKFEEYSKLLAPVFTMSMDKGIVEARAGTEGEDGWVWCTTSHSYLHKMFELVGNDKDAEVLILGSTGENFTKSIGAPDAYRDTSKPYVMMPEAEYPMKVYDHMYEDGTVNIERQVNLEIPTIGIWQGGAFHSEIFLLCDITIATEDAWMTEQHFRVNMVPGDGVGIPWRMLMGQKRFAYAELTGEIITARKALELGMINEIVPDLESAYKRAREIADLIMHSGTRQTRRLTTKYIRQPVVETAMKETRPWFGTEMWATITEDAPHHPIYWKFAKAQAEAVKNAEKKGKIVKPRIGPFIEEEKY